MWLLYKYTFDSEFLLIIIPFLLMAGEGNTIHAAWCEYQDLCRKFDFLFFNAKKLCEDVKDENDERWIIYREIEKEMRKAKDKKSILWFHWYVKKETDLSKVVFPNFYY